jgi:large subunit ribosomal protein L18
MVGMQQGSREDARAKRHWRVRQKITGRSERPRLSVFRSQKHIYAQVVDDTTGQTLASASTVDPAFRKKVQKGSDRAAATAVGQLLAERALAANVRQVVFDRGGYLFHGRVKALADGARSAGLEF